MKFSSSLKLNHIFRRLYHTSGQADSYLVLYARKNRTAENRVGITVSKKLGHAVVRNRARRRLRELFRLSQGQMLQGYDVLLVARGKTARIPHRYLKRDYEAAVKKLGLFVQEEQP